MQYTRIISFVSFTLLLSFGFNTVFCGIPKKKLEKILASTYVCAATEALDLLVQKKIDKKSRAYRLLHDLNKSGRSGLVHALAFSHDSLEKFNGTSVSPLYESLGYTVNNFVVREFCSISAVQSLFDRTYA